LGEVTTAPDLTSLTMDALGKPITDAAAQRLAVALGKKGLKTATPGNTYSIGSSRKLGLEVGVSVEIFNRTYWPPRKQGRVWLTYVVQAFFFPNYRGASPGGFDFTKDDAALSALYPRRVEGALQAVRFRLPPPAPHLTLRAELGQDGRTRNLYCAVARERDYVSVYPDTAPELYVEDGFFVAWAAARGLLRPGRLSEAALDDLRQRRATPLAVLHDGLGGLFWQSDVEPEYDDFCNAYLKRLMTDGEVSQLDDARRIFGETNYWRRPLPPVNEDSWANYDRIAPLYDDRLRQWRAGELASIV
jgi:hypothetical protein